VYQESGISNQESGTKGATYFIGYFILPPTSEQVSDHCLHLCLSVFIYGLFLHYECDIPF